MKKQYLFETHCHTSETSKCSRIPGKDLATFYKSEGYDGIIITDHFLNGNTTVPRELPWKERIHEFMAGYLSAKNEGDKIGLTVLFGLEFSYKGTDFLIYGIDENWLLEHEDCDKMPVRDFCNLVKNDGGFVVQAHPAREAGYIDHIRLFPRSVDAVEIYNAGNKDFENEFAELYAKYYQLPFFAGSDNHVGKAKRITGLLFDEEVKDPSSLLHVLKNHSYSIYKKSFDV